MPPSAAAEVVRPAKMELGAAALAKMKWESSGLNDDHAKKLKMKGLMPEDTQALGPNFHAAKALYLPYFDLEGKVTKFFRVRYLEKLPGWAGVIEKPQRYAQPKGTVNEVYLPPLLPLSWRQIAEDPKVPIYITEGELKAACACSRGMACVGLGGVDVWRAAKREIPLLPALQQIKWTDRQVVIIYDSDAATNPDVVRAQRKLAEKLVDLGAMPSIASLPPRKDGNKQGLDDLIVAEGVEALNPILRDAPAFPEAAALWEMNEEVCCIHNPGMMVVKQTGQKIDVRKFVGLTHANRHYMEMIPNKDGVIVPKKRKLAPRWIEWEHRHEVEGITYAPGRPRVFDGQWNDWPGWGVEPRRGDVGPWTRLLDYLFKGHPKPREWFERWCAYPLQHPGAKLYTAPMIWSQGHGVGKTAVAYCLMKIYGTNAIEIKNKHLRGGFNSWQRNRQFVYGDEIEGNADVTSKKIDSEWLKGLITQHEVTVNEKYLPEYTVPDCMNYLFTSNKPDAVFMDDADRRFFIHEVVGGPLMQAWGQDVVDTLDAWLHGDGPAFLFDHLLRLKLGDFHPKAHAPWTMAKEQMIQNSKTDLGMWCGRLREDPERILARFGERVAKECDLFTVTQLMNAYDPDGKTRASMISLGKELQKAGLRRAYEGQPVRTPLGIQRLIAVRNGEQWENAKAKAVSDHFNKFFGDGTTKYT